LTEDGDNVEESPLTANPLIFLFSDYGIEGPYLGQVETILRLAVPSVSVINLASNAPFGEPRLSAYLLAAVSRNVPAGGVVFAVVDPGVGTARLAVVLEADGRWFVGPDNGLLNTVAVHAQRVQWRIIEWRPENLSSTFHGRDLFAPVAARIANRDWTWTSGCWVGPSLEQWPADIASIVYFDHYGNAMTGCRYTPAHTGRSLVINGHRLAEAQTFNEMSSGSAFWYRNSLGLIEIAVNRGSAEEALSLRVGMRFALES
jgi:S-adenosyl-L-methionine hydrolase (adenosine-forming)